jgi:8-oxo-dGTP diphosphatase
MKPERSRPHVAVLLLLIKDNKVLLQRRFKTGYADGWYNLVSGHVDNREFAKQALVREAKEEAGIDVEPENLKFMHIQQLVPCPGEKEFVYLYFECKKWKGEPKIMEPEKHDDLSWFPLNELPVNTIPYMKLAIEQSQKGINYSEYDLKYVLDNFK